MHSIPVRAALVAATILTVSLTAPTVSADERPVHHVVLFQFKEGTSPSDIAEVSRRFAQLPNDIAGVRGFQWGTNNSPEGLNDGLTHAYVLTFENQAALDAYGPHERHQAFVEFALPKVEKVFVNDFAVDSVSPVAEPGRCHHLVFFKYKEGTDEAKLAEVAKAFRGLEAEIPGILAIQHGEDRTPEDQRSGFVHAYWLTFTNERARADYLPHPAHKAFVGIVGPVLDKPLVVDFTVRPSGRSLFVTHGLEPYRVYQRGDDGTATFEFGGVCSGDGPIEARLRHGRRPVEGFDWKGVGEAKAGVFQATLAAVPTGGEYTVEVRRRDARGNVAAHTEVANILVGDLWILAGQSNMQGYGDLVGVETPHRLVHCYTMGHRWELAEEPLHWLVDSPDPIHSGRLLAGTKNESERRDRRRSTRASRSKGAGLGLTFAKEVVEATGVPIGLIASAHGGTSMRQWDPAARDRGGESLYGSLLKQVGNAGGKVRGVLWYQGESDANPQAVPEFSERFRGLVDALRSDFGAKLPMYYVQIGRFVVDRDSAPWDAIQELQRRAESEIPGVGMVSVIDLGLDDLIHVGTEGLKRTGRRLARLALRETYGLESLSRGPRPAEARASENRRELRVQFSGVSESLVPGRGIRGFELVDPDGKVVRTIYKAVVDPKAPDTIVLSLQNPLPDGAKLVYGRGLDPVCNLRDESDMAAPAFGPMEITR